MSFVKVRKAVVDEFVAKRAKQESKQNSANRHRVSGYPLSPATPPDKRVRIRRFEELRSTETGDTQPISPAEIEDSVQRCAAVAPQAAHIACHQQRNIRPCAPCQKLSISGRATPPLLQLDGPHPVAYPLVQFLPDPRSIRQPEVSLPTQHIAAQSFHHLFKAAFWLHSP